MWPLTAHRRLRARAASRSGSLLMDHTARRRSGRARGASGRRRAVAIAILPGRTAARRLPSAVLQRRLRALGLRRGAARWLRQYPSCFRTFADPATGAPHFALAKPLAALAADEAAALAAAEPAMADRLARLLMLARGRRLGVPKLAALRRALGLPDDYLLRLAARFPGRFRVAAHGGRRGSMEIELAEWEPALAVSAVEAAAAARGDAAPGFACSLPESWRTARARFEEFHAAGYVSPYAAAGAAEEGSERRAVAVVHEVLSLTLWKKASIVKLGHFSRELGLPQRLHLLLLRHPGIFYVSNRNNVHTVVLRDGYRGSELVEKDPLVVVKERLGELMQEGLHEYNRRRQQANIEKRRRRGDVAARKGAAEKAEGDDDDDEHAVAAAEGNGVLGMEERRRFYRVLFDEDFQ